METLAATKIVPAQKNLIETAAELGPAISQHVFEEENMGRLSPPVISALRNAGLFKLFLPASLGGLETDPLTMARIVEEIATHNTAAGWSLMVANTAHPMMAQLSDQGVREVFANGSDTFIAGSVHPPMRATAARDGFIINGRNPLLSNIHEAQWIFVTALVMDGDAPKLTGGNPEVLGVVMKSSDITIIDTWNTIGMRATDSNDAEAKDVFVPGHLTFPLVPDFKPNLHYKGPLYRVPAAAANIACLLAPVSIAVAKNAISELLNLADKKTPLGSMVPLRERGTVQRKLGRAESLVAAARCYLHDQLGKCWDKVASGNSVTREEKARLLLAAAHANQCAVEAVELVYTASGTHGIYLKNKLAHYMVDMQVLRQHGFMNESRYETAAQILLGRPCDLPLIEF